MAYAAYQFGNTLLYPFDSQLIYCIVGRVPIPELVLSMILKVYLRIYIWFATMKSYVN